ncbi:MULTISPECIES: D-glycero-beta-D-manno-heptose 1,7-bisphosphate 7-phosphatase [Cupriavidus]|jgi:D-glycero-D-manno-heptose 1,7-bisphosphate phosphatase|uniref:D,D-heptose 1,7-bisphosphate phosphatase n=1 Tax=Cupriavidus metallidurans TaxID=119219 RepID=A0A132HH13_9BURK|nr:MULTISPECIES: D-glycero-beta-D-manno-heptose 1,7-bisphosphate 7-phosphatase [Cupriavidus]EKZ99743.1 D,D-heptose 1,7-bisphosphate phosphatase [Cupriavidus sp. HMR-1]KWR83550.1 D,D-heptose 1,7-bisphosphate phosphatase [Cupriavidus sp. SHE]KWW36092.1 D-glycero-beta-D-manno-heptose-1,7-bisphosphate 7-phosphatase [Cupriavidus metallidurans]QBP08641.1 D-glycero-beta-D-manno-heptose 1,7-bisphosphate 7-phosphatase [Cupriavidus metallidurans]QWC89064.1 D-glycero-beta-D-manno-heptose 1,7-bisphosphate
MPQSQLKFVILDRDGVINRDSDQFIKTPDEWIPIEGSLEAIAMLNQAGYRVVVASNQSGIGRGLFEMSALNAMHEKMYKALANLGGRVEAIFFCPHTAADNCDCRKPKSGLYEQIGERFGIELRTAPTVGDSLRDLQAGVAVGCIPHLVRTGKGMKTLEKGGLPDGTRVHDDLAAFARWLIDDAAPKPQPTAP